MAKPTADWSVVAHVLGATSYEGQLDLALETIAEATGHSLAYLYLPDASGRYLRLERSRGTAESPQLEPKAAASSVSAELVTTPEQAAFLHADEGQEGGAGWSAPTPPLELRRSDDDARARVVETPVGDLYALPVRGEDGELVAVLQSGPHSGRDLGRPAKRRVEALREPLAFSIQHIIAAASVRQRLSEATARLEAQERIAGSALDVTRFTQLLLDMALRSTRTDAGFVAIQREGGEKLEVRASSAMPEGFADAVDLAPEGGLFDWSVAEFGGALALADFDAATRWGIKSLLAVPLMEEGQPLGIFSLVNFGEGGTFEASGLELCAVFAEQIRLMLNNQRLFRDFADRYLETLKSLARALDARRPQTFDHHQRVAETAAGLAHLIGMRGPALRATWQAGLIHDVGLASVPDSDVSESDIEHPSVGASLVEHLPVHPELVGAVATHHEWYDGWGFPAGLAGDQIPLGGRVMAMAEFMTEMSTETPVRPAWPPERLSEEIAQRRGTQFDPTVADAAIGLLSARQAQVPASSRR